ncbi:MAG TPA: tryptophan--tRNA ligase, partial [Deltaproteobacteria bacterium]|nr:tryptophan--tRNA ligase [Deltaproteobacteria bacterium]
MTEKKRSLSGIKPTGTPHLGNYLGMIKPAIKMQATHQTFYFIADYHALT